ncbi:MAG TPA: alpha/beta hydrolase [Pseudomonadales bacterium]|nr:alpha/beta hydrolase [Pseudomonadales bacterium]
MDKQFLEVSGIRLAYFDTGGGGPVILFVHGNSSAAQTFSRQLASDLAETYRLVAVELPGHGESGRVPVSDYGVPFYAKRVAAFASALGIDDAILVGWSLGGHIALECTDIMPKVPGVLIYGTPPLRRPPNLDEAFLPNPLFAVGMTGILTQEQVAAYARSFLGDKSNPALEAEFVEEIRSTDPNAREGLAKSVSGTYLDEVELVADMARPLAILHGRQEQLVSLEYIEALTMPTLWRGAVQLIDDAGHSPHVETTQVFNGLVGAFAGELS